MFSWALNLSEHQLKMVDDERGPYGDADASRGIEGVSMNGRGPLKSNSSA